MRIKYITTLCAFIENDCNMRKTAERMSTDSHAIKKNLRNLEIQLEKKLFYSQRQKLLPTPEAIKFYHRIKNHHKLLNNVIEQARSTNDKINLAITDAFLCCWIKSFFEDLFTQYPNVEVDSFDDSVDLVQKNCDLFLGSKIESSNSDNIFRKHLCDFHIMMCASTKYLNKNGLPKNLQDFSSHKLIGYSHIPAYFTEDDPNFHLKDLGFVENRLTFRNSYNMVQAIENGWGIGPISLQSALSSKQEIVPILPELFQPQKIEVYCFSQFDIDGDEKISGVYETIKNSIDRKLANLEKKYKALPESRFDWKHLVRQPGIKDE